MLNKALPVSRRAMADAYALVLLLLEVLDGLALLIERGMCGKDMGGM